MAKKFVAYLGHPVSNLLEDAPFKNWHVERSLEDDLDDPIVQYVFPRHGVELRCNDKGRICTIFVDTDDLDGLGDTLLDVSFSWSRKKVIEYYGAPSQSGGKVSDPTLGDYGAWDRFVLPGYAVHVEYRTDSDGIKKITFMQEDVVPYAAFP